MQQVVLQIALQGSVQEVFSHNEELKNMGLDVPHITSVFLRLKEMGVDLGADVFTIPQAVERITKAVLGGGGNA